MDSNIIAFKSQRGPSQGKSPALYFTVFKNGASHFLPTDVEQVGVAYQVNFDGPPPNGYETWNQYLVDCFEKQVLFNVTIKANQCDNLKL